MNSPAESNGFTLEKQNLAEQPTLLQHILNQFESYQRIVEFQQTQFLLRWQWQ